MELSRIDAAKVDFVGHILGDHGRLVVFPRLELYCSNSKKCINRSYKLYSGVKGQFNMSGVQILVCEADTGERLGRAFRHLMKVTGQVKELF